MPGVKAVLFLAASVLMTVSCGASESSDSGTEVSTAALQTTTYRVGGMHCGGCAAAIATKVGQVDGVASCNVDLESGTAVVEAAPDSEQRIQDAIVLLGYTVNPVADPVVNPADDQIEAPTMNADAATTSG